jgi:hypothetical protein
MVNQEYKNPQKLLMAFLDSFSQPMWILDKAGNVLMNAEAREYSNSGFDILKYAQDLSVGASKVVQHMGKHFILDKKDINHGTNSCVCTLQHEEDPLQRLKKSTAKFTKAYSNIYK